MQKKNVPPDIYAQAAAIAKSYYVMLCRRQQQEQQPPATDGPARLSLPYERNSWKLRAVEQAWARMADDTAREFIRRNIFEGARMRYIPLPLSVSTMKRLRRRFITYVAEELGDI